MLTASLSLPSSILKCLLFEEADIQQLMEDMVRELFAAVLNIQLPSPFPSITYAEALQRFGTDRPDMRFGMELIDITDIMQQVEFKVFAGPAKDPNGRVAVINFKQGAKLSRKEIDEYTKFVSKHGAKGLAYIKVNALQDQASGLQSPILKFLNPEVIAQILQRSQAEDGDILFFGADDNSVVAAALSALRSKLAEDFNLYTESWSPVWVTDFPMFEKNDEDRWQALHHPFTSPQENAPTKTQRQS